jgi:hypothetical protein
MAIELQNPPATHVWTGEKMVKRIDKLTLEEAREVIVRLCDDLQEARDALLAELRKQGHD